MKQLKCDLCGTPVKIVGHTTKHYEPIVPSVEEIEDALNAFWDEWEAPSNDVYSKDLAVEISKLIRG